jgi:hypothetical protein
MAITNITPLYKINGTGFRAPARAGWVIPPKKGLNGQGANIYEPYSTFEFTWTEMLPEDFKVIRDLWAQNYNSGTFTVDLPEYGSVNYQFKTYTGVQMDQPEISNYDFGYFSTVTLTIRKIRV